MGATGEWRRLCGLLDDDETVWAAVGAALEQGDDPWEALFDALDEAGALAYLQTEDTGMELADALPALPRVFALQPDLNRVTDTDELEEATSLADAILTPAGLRLVRLVEPDDEESWPIVVVRRNDAEAVAGLVGALGGLAVVGG